MRTRGVLVVLVTIGSACTDGMVGTSPMAHESPPPLDAGPDTELTWSTYLGGSGFDRALDVWQSLDGASLFVVGGTGSADFPGAGGAVDTTSWSGGECDACPSDAFVTRIDRDGQQLWTTVIGGDYFEEATTVYGAPGGDVFVGGSAHDLPATTGAADPSFAGGDAPGRGGQDGFVCRLDGATGDVEWCTFVGGAGPGGVSDLVGLSGGDVAVVTEAGDVADLATDSSYAAAFAGRHRSSAAGADAVVLRLTGDGGQFVWASYVGGTGDELGTPSITRGPVLSVSAISVLMETTSVDAPTPGGLQTSPGGGRDAYLMSLGDDGVNLIYGTYLGGSGDESVGRHALMGPIDLVVGLSTTSFDMFTSPNAYQQTYRGGTGAPGCGDGDGWLAVITPGTAPGWRDATYLGGGEGDVIEGVAFNPQGLGVVGYSYSQDFPVHDGPGHHGAGCIDAPGNSDGFLAVFDYMFLYPHFVGMVGGADADRFHASAGFVASTMVGETLSDDYPQFDPLPGGTLGAGSGAFTVLGGWRIPPPPPDDDGDAGLPCDGGFPGDPDAGTDDPGDGGCGCRTGGGGGPAVLAVVVLVPMVVRRRCRVADGDRRA